jgi:aspartyl-tRNA(Asn)/glutamyl-tRNA(Gln) amidotransferase subunit A
MNTADGLSIAEFGRLWRAGALRALDVTEACLDRIARRNPALNAFITTLADTALEDAARADRELAAGHDRGALHGVPISVKDLIDIRGTPTTAASRVRDGHVAARDAACIATLRRSGAVLIGKTNLHEFAFGTTSEDSAFGPVRNPHDTSRSAGGSSGGSAVSVAAAMALGSVGTDTGGSIRIPAAACGVVGLKPTFGEIPTDGVVPLSRPLDHVGPITRTVEDAWLLHQTLAGSTSPKALIPAPPGGLRLGIPRKYFLDLLEDGVREAFEHAIDAVRNAGVRVIDVDVAHAGLAPALYLAQVFGDAAAYHAETLESMPDRYTPPVRLRLEMARYLLAEDYVRAIEGRVVLQREVDAALSSCDGLVLPALAIEAPPIGAPTVKLGGEPEPVRTVMLRLTQAFNLTGHPAVALPCGASPSGLPYGMQIVGARGMTASLCSIAASVHRVLPG